MAQNVNGELRNSLTHHKDVVCDGGIVGPAVVCAEGGSDVVVLALVGDELLGRGDHNTVQGTQRGLQQNETMLTALS
jgi:hypothetical protein